MKTIYLSYPYTDRTPSYGDGDRFSVAPVDRMEAGGASNKCRFSMTNHIGTHVDGPLHFDPAGEPLDGYPPEFWIVERVAVLDIPATPEQLKESGYLLPFDLATAPRMDAEALIVRTGYWALRGTERYWRENPGLRPEWADFLRAHCPSLRFLLIDSISVSSWQNRQTGRHAHREFLSCAKGPILLVEDADLSGLDGMRRIESLFILPLRIAGADSAPVTVIARGE